MKKISVIVPVYNSEEFIERCIKSIINQTLKDIEIILINDGSTDKSQEIIERYKNEYPNIIKAKKIKNSGAANARNVGLTLAEGEYIGFLDSDDYIDEKMYEKMYNKACKESADIVVSAYFVENKKNIRAYQLGHMEQYGKSIKENPDIFVYGVPYLWNKIFRRKIIEEKIKFSNNIKIFEDLEIVYKAYIKANKISKVDEPLYYYVKENPESLTAKFSEKFFDIFSAIKGLKEFCKQNRCYYELKDYILFIALNHIYIRCNMRVNTNQYKMKINYINSAFDFLNKEFPDWEQHQYYFEIKRKNKKKYTSKLYWKRNTLIKMLRIDIILKKYRKIKRKIKKYNNIGGKYIKYYKTMPINEKLILIDSQHGNDINGNMFYIIKELCTNIEYREYKIWLGVSKKRKKEFERKIEFYNLTEVNLVVNETKKYMKLLASAKFLFTDTSFNPYFIKKDGQIYLNTWHGTPLKTLGRSTKKDFEGIANLQKNFVVADYLLYPSEYMMTNMINDYMLENVAKNKVLLAGYPRNAVFLNDDRREKVREELNLKGKEVIAYMPTWRGTLSKKNTKEYIEVLKKYLDIISKNLNTNQILYVNVHPYIKDYIEFKNFNNILAFPSEYETYDFLNVCDILITDYSSVFFDFALTRKKIILFTYDKEEYLSERGLYLNLEELPFPEVDNALRLIEEINNKQINNYDQFIKKFCNYDRPNISNEICNMIVLNKKTNLKILDIPCNKKNNVLILVKNFSNKLINKKLFELIEETNEIKYNYYIGYVSRWVRKYSYNLLKLPREFKYMGQLFSFCDMSTKDKITFKLYNKLNKKIRFNLEHYREIMKNELKRIYGNIEFNAIFVFGEEKRTRIDLFANYSENALKILYKKNNDKEGYYNNKYNYVLRENDINRFKNINQIIEIGEKK